jgi:hypothetical protein
MHVPHDSDSITRLTLALPTLPQLVEWDGNQLGAPPHGPDLLPADASLTCPV